MLLENAYYLSQILAALAIVGSLLFVGLQLRQNDRTQRAIMHETVVNRTIETTKFYYGPEHARVFAKLSVGSSEMSGAEIPIAAGLMRINVMNLEDALWQQENGFLSDDAVQSTIASSRRLFAMPGIRMAFELWRGSFSQAQLTMIDKLGLMTAPLQSMDMDAAWKSIAETMPPKVPQ